MGKSRLKNNPFIGILKARSEYHLVVSRVLKNDFPFDDRAPARAAVATAAAG